MIKIKLVNDFYQFLGAQFLNENLKVDDCTGGKGISTNTRQGRYYLRY
ncbi:MAG: hypothetical protein Q8891_09050 [Bacteroidota bacterium]|nr:hypothetical protein [Bacteroidota bacterium]